MADILFNSGQILGITISVDRDDAFQQVSFFYPAQKVPLFFKGKEQLDPFETFCSSCYLLYNPCPGGYTQMTKFRCHLGNDPRSNRYVDQSVLVDLPIHVCTVYSDFSKYWYFVSDLGNQLVLPLRLGNVQDSGAWCSGGVRIEYLDNFNPIRLWEAFFTTIKNGDYAPSNESIAVTLKKVSEDFNYLESLLSKYRRKSIEDITGVNKAKKVYNFGNPKGLRITENLHSFSESESIFKVSSNLYFQVLTHE